jgi:hypothetical protein
MGQTIQIRDANVVGDVLLVSTDRSFTGQDGETYHPGKPADSGAIFPAQLAARLFESDSSIDHVYVMSNVLSIKRVGEWDDASVASATDIVTSFFLFYGAQPPADDQPPIEAEPAPAEEA